MSAHARNVHITSAYITLGQLLKFAGIVSSGVDAKVYLSTHKVLVNKELDTRRGRKLYVGDEIELDKEVLKIN